MPYIAESYRVPYEELAKRFFEQNPSGSAAASLGRTWLEVLKRVYGDHADTRYYLQNAAIGMLACCLQEWCRRLDFSLTDLPDADWLDQDATPDPEFLSTLLELLPQGDHTQRDGHLNFLLFTCMREAVERGLLTMDSAADFIQSLADEHYEVIVGPYEDAAIRKNGDVKLPQ